MGERSQCSIAHGSTSKTLLGVPEPMRRWLNWLQRFVSVNSLRAGDINVGTLWRSIILEGHRCKRTIMTFYYFAYGSVVG